MSKWGEQLRKSFIQQDVESPCTIRSGGEVGARGGRRSQSLLRDSLARDCRVPAAQLGASGLTKL